jgi:hypothetical protein
LGCRVWGLGVLITCAATGASYEPASVRLATCFQVSSFVSRVSGFGFRVSGFGFQVSGIGFRVSGFGFRISGFGFRVSGSGFRLAFCTAECDHYIKSQQASRDSFEGSVWFKFGHATPRNPGPTKPAYTTERKGAR